MLNRRTHIARWGFVALIAVGLGACPPVTSKSPLGTTVATTPPDPALTGVWKSRKTADAAESYFTFFPQDDGSLTLVVVTPPAVKDKGGWGAYSMRTVTLGPYHYMNARETIDQGKPATGRMADDNIPVLYRINGDGTLVLYIIDEAAAKEAITAGKIAGTIEKAKDGDVTLIAGPADLDAYMASPAGRALFDKPLVMMRRVK